MKRLLLSSCFALGLGLWAPEAVRAQAAIAGSVVSDEGDALVGLSVTLIHLPTGTRREVTTDGHGQFAMSELPSGGPYALRLLHPRYQQIVLNDVFLAPCKTGSFVFTLLPAVASDQRHNSIARK